MNTTKKIAHTTTRLVGTFVIGGQEYKIDIPKGTRCKRIDIGSTAGHYWVDDLSWIDPKRAMLKHDAYFYGIVLKPDQVE